MADVVIRTKYPASSIVGLYSALQLIIGQSAPVGSSISDHTVGTDGRVAITGLPDGQAFALYAPVNGRDVVLRFATPEPSVAGTGGVGPQGPIGPSGPAGGPGPPGAEGPQGPLGPQGSDGTGFVWKGTWSGATAYVEGDVVFQSDVTYYAKASSTNQAPPNATFWDVFPIESPPGPQGPTGPTGPAGAAGAIGPQGPAGAPGTAGASGATVSDAVRGQSERFTMFVGGVLTHDGVSAFVPNNDQTGRPQNFESATTDSQKITIVHEDIAAIHVIEAHAQVGENLSSIGVYPVVRPHVDSTDILLKQTRRLDDALTNTGSAWTKEKGPASPFAVTGLTSATDDFPGTITALANLASYYRLSEASGAVLDDATAGSHDGAVVGSGATYAVTGGLLSDGTDKAITTTGISTNELTFPITGTGVTQAAMSVILRLNIPFANKLPFRDHTTLTGTGYFVASNLGSPNELIQYRAGSSGSTYTTSTPWSELADDQWHTLIFTKDGANVALYLDGVLIHSASSAGSTGLVSPWHVGRSGSGSTYYAGTLSEFATVSRAVTLSEAAAIHGAAEEEGVLRVSHVDMGSTRASEITLTPQGLLRPVLVAGSVTATGFAVKFYDDTGTQVTVADTDMAVNIARQVTNRPVDPSSLRVDILVFPELDWEDAVAAIAPGLWARLGESSGTTLADSVGTNDGAVQATVTLGAAGAIVGDADTAITLDGAQGKVAFANPSLVGPFTISQWFKCTGAGSVGATTYGTLIGWSSGVSTRRIAVHHSDGQMYIETGGAILLTGTGVAPTNEWNHLVYTWDGTTQKVIVNGQLIASGVTANVTLNAPFWLGSYTGTSANWSFKGSFDEFMLDDRAWSLAEAQQLFVTGRQTSFTVDRSATSSITFGAEYETLAPLPDPGEAQAAPVATPLPAGDTGGGATSIASLGPYRSVLNGFYDWVGRALPAAQVDRDAILLNGLPGLPAATSTTWKDWFCLQFGIDPSTGASTGSGLSGAATPLYISTSRYNVFVVPDDQPLRDITDLDTTVPGWATQVNAAIDARGGLPVPADALPDTSGDKYAFVFQPGVGLIATIYAYQPQAVERARTTLELTGSPSAGGFFLDFDYLDNVNRSMQTFLSQSPVLYNFTAAQLQALLFASKTAAGAALGSLRANSTPALVTGGPLNVAPLVIDWVLGGPLQPVGMRIRDNFMNSGSVQFTYDNADAWSGSRLSAVTSPDVSGGHVPILSGSKACATATRILQLPLIIDWAEYKIAYDIGIASGWDAPGTDLGHVIGMVIGNCGTGNVYPATAGDGTLSNTDGSKMKEGALCTFPVDADFSRVAPEMMPLANTVKRYGFMVYDKTGIGSEFVCRNWIWPGQTRPFPGPSTFKTSSPNPLTYMRQLPWHQMQIIDPAEVLAGW